jgi:hypothetical protein
MSLHQPAKEDNREVTNVRPFIPRRPQKIEQDPVKRDDADDHDNDPGPSAA